MERKNRHTFCKLLCVWDPCVPLYITSGVASLRQERYATLSNSRSAKTATNGVGAQAIRQTPFSRCRSKLHFSQIAILYQVWLCYWRLFRQYTPSYLACCHNYNIALAENIHREKTMWIFLLHNCYINVVYLDIKVTYIGGNCIDLLSNFFVCSSM